MLSDLGTDLAEVAHHIAEHLCCGEPVPAALAERRETLQEQQRALTGTCWPRLPDYAPADVRRRVEGV